MSDIEFAVGVALAIALVISGITWCIVIRRAGWGQPLIAYEPRPLVPWGLVDVLLLIVLMFSIAVAAQYYLQYCHGIPVASKLIDLDSDQRVLRLLASAFGSISTAAVSLLILACRKQHILDHLGVTPLRMLRDIQLGVIAFVMLVPGVYLIQVILTRWFESKHPLVEMLRDDPDPRLIALTGLSAVIVAPFVEEYIYRVLTQGWMENVASGPSDPETLWSGAKSYDNGPRIQSKQADGPVAVAWPIVVSAAVFALMHLSHGPDFVPLFVLAVGLGYVYQRTHRILPCIVVHFLLNAVSMGVLLLDIFS